MIHPILVEAGVEPQDRVIDLGLSDDPLLPRAHVSVVLRCIDVAQTVAAALIVLRRVGLTHAPVGAYRARRNYEAYFVDSGEATGELAERLRGAGDSARVKAIVEPTNTQRALGLEDRIYAVACWLLWGDPLPGEPWGLDAVACELASECGAELLPQYALSAARGALEDVSR